MIRDWLASDNWQWQETVRIHVSRQAIKITCVTRVARAPEYHDKFIEFNEELIDQMWLAEEREGVELTDIRFTKKLETSTLNVKRLAKLERKART